MDSRLLQLSDSAFPSGAFAHSFGFEALRQLGHLRGEEALSLRLAELVWHTAHGSLPFLNDAHRADPVSADRLADAFLSNHVANRASRAQGQSFLVAAEATFGSLLIVVTDDRGASGANALTTPRDDSLQIAGMNARGGSPVIAETTARAGPLARGHESGSLRSVLPFGHVAVAVGSALRAASLPLSDARQLFLFGAVRGALSATVRLGVVGPLRAQAILFSLHALMDRALAETSLLSADDACGCAPLLDVSQGAQDRLYSRLFQS